MQGRMALLHFGGKMKEAKINLESMGVEEYEGSVTVEVLKFRDRLKYSKDLNFKTDDSGEVVVDGDMLATTMKMIELTEKHFIAVDIKHKESGEEAKSFEDLECNPVFDRVIPTICGAVLNAGRVGKP